MPQTESSAPRDTSGLFGPHFPTVESLRRSIQGVIASPYSDGVDRLAMSMLSDVQEMIGMGRLERAGQRINVVKWILDNRASLEVGAGR